MQSAGQTSLLHIVGQDTPLRREASTNGGEYSGACVWCGGTDRMRVWPDADRPAFWCRVCEKHGDGIEYLRLKGMSFQDACREVGATPEPPRGVQNVVYAPAPPEPPCEAWQARAVDWLWDVQQALWEDAGQRAFDWLIKRGFTRDTILRGGLGYQAQDTWEPREDWGLDPRDDVKNVWLPRGIVIPWMVGGVIWKAIVRRPAGDPKYHTINASANALYNADELAFGEPAVLVEGAFDALAVQQETGIAAVACGTTGARGLTWVHRLSLCAPVLVALDGDEGGDAGAKWWCDVLQARRWRPFVKDPAEMLERGIHIKPWIEAGLEATYATV